MKTRNISTAKEILDALRPSGEIWRNTDFVPIERPFWLYRGQMNAEWGLTPSLFRKAPIDSDPNFTRYSEYSLIQVFLRIADREGLLPTGFELPREPIASGNPWWNNPDLEIPYEALNIYALAQHHGIKTRLLDWTTSPLSAAYFAASDNWKISLNSKKETPSHFSIWALVRHGSRQIKVVSPRQSDNLYLRSQRGHFTIDPSADRNYSLGWKPHDVLVKEDEKSDDGTISTNKEMLIKIVAPSNIAEEVMILLRYEGVDEASLMPSFDSIARCAKNELLLHKKETGLF